ncbi:hypothetical protein SSX86_020937 [Deinandra increscens subsp. villosa]|uniref:Alpha-ketoglutarate-dependent dioxygenase AlkB-like domain-containing protein n=1 Tax=Deinandra increscens subsp. villosa TaxID=3103831 RepID=A0AAP0CVQ0_9ASTR
MQKGAFHGSLIGTCKQYITVPAALVGYEFPEETEPFNVVDPSRHICLNGSWTDRDKASYNILGSGMILLKNYINIKGQVGIVNTIQRCAVGPGRFYEPRNQYGDKLRLHMTTFGRNWDPVTRYEKRCRSDDESAGPPPIPYSFIYLAETAIKDAQTYMNGLPSMHPDICVANFYYTCGRLGIHQDRDESSESLESGLPVVSISVGYTGEFWYGHTKDESKLCKVLLESGDVLIFGGESRLVFHGVKKIIPMSSPSELTDLVELRPGRLNLTLKQV